MDLVSRFMTWTIGQMVKELTEKDQVSFVVLRKQ